MRAESELVSFLEHLFCANYPVIVDNRSIFRSVYFRAFSRVGKVSIEDCQSLLKYPGIKLSRSSKRSVRSLTSQKYMGQFRQVFDFVHFQRYHFNHCVLPGYTPIVVDHDRHVFGARCVQTNRIVSTDLRSLGVPTSTGTCVLMFLTFPPHCAGSSANQRPSLSVHSDERPRHSCRRKQECRRSEDHVTTTSQL